MTEVYRRVKHALEGELAKLGARRGKESHEDKVRREVLEELIAEQYEEKRKKEAADAQATLMRMMEEERSPAREAGPIAVAFDRNSTLACILPVGTPENTHQITSGWQYVSRKPKSGEDGKWAPTHNEMSNLNGSLIISGDSTVGGKVGGYVDNAINQWRRLYINKDGVAFLVSYVTYPGLCMGGIQKWWSWMQSELYPIDAG